MADFKYTSLFYNSSIDKIQLVRKILQDNDYAKLCKIEAKTPTTFKGLLSLSFLRRKNYHSINSSGFILGKPYEEYVGMLAFIFKQNSKYINKYIENREKYETSLLLGQYDEAKQYLQEIKAISYSTWTLEQDIKLERLNSGLGACTRLYNKLYKESGNFCSYMALISYQTSSIEYSFESDIRLHYEKFKASANKDTLGYFVSHCMAFYPYEFSNWVKWDLNSSLLDLYDNFMIALNVVDDEMMSNKTFQANVLHVYEHIRDKRLSTFLMKHGLISYEMTNGDVEREGIIRNYYSGNYQAVMDIYPEYGNKKPWDTALLDLYVKSLILLDAPCPLAIDDNSSIYDKLLIYYYRYLTKADNRQTLYYRNMKTICYSCYSIYGIAHLWNIINAYETNDIFHMFDKFECFSYGRSVRGKNVSKNSVLDVDIRNYETDKELMELLLKPELLTKAEVFDGLFDLLEAGKVAVFLKDQVCSFLFKRLLDEGKLCKAVSFFVVNKVNDTKLNIQFNKNELKEIFEDDYDLKNEIPLELSVFYTMIGFEDYKRYLPYKKVLSLYGVKHASELNISKNKLLIYFLANVVDTKVLSLYVQRYDTLNDVLEERMKICSLLFDNTDNTIFKDEITQIYRELSIRSLTKKIDESKIYVDVNKIIAEGLNEEKVLFDLFQNTDESMKYYNSLDSLIKLMAKEGLNINIYVPVDNSATINYKYSLCEKLFLCIRNRFLSDPKYGLDFFLSTRIRHGTLINQLRHQFQAHNLVTNIGDNNLYKDDEYWTNDICLHDERTLYFVRQKFKKFSKELDAYIFRLKNEVIQIKTELVNTDKKAAFDFSKDKIASYIKCVFDKSAGLNFAGFVNLIFETLWNITDRRLVEVKHVIDDMQVDICKMLTNLEKDISDELGNEYRLTHFQTAIRSCKTDFQHDMDIVKSWFVKNDKTDFSFDIKNVVDACLRMHNRINTSPLRVNMEIASKSMLKGVYFDKLNDLFHDLFNNVTSYCKSIQKPLNCKVVIKEIDENISIEVSNKLREEDIPEVQNIIDNFKEKEKNMLLSGMGQRENCSGFVKISNIVTYLLPGTNNYFNSIVDSNFVANIFINLKSIRA